MAGLTPSLAGLSLKPAARAPRPRVAPTGGVGRIMTITCTSSTWRTWRSRRAASGSAAGTGSAPRAGFNQSRVRGGAVGCDAGGAHPRPRPRLARQGRARPTGLSRPRRSRRSWRQGPWRSRRRITLSGRRPRSRRPRGRRRRRAAAEKAAAAEAKATTKAQADMTRRRQDGGGRGQGGGKAGRTLPRRRPRRRPAKAEATRAKAC